MAIRDSTQSGNTHSAPFAFGSAVNDGDQLRITNSAHAITFDANCTLGVAPCGFTYPRPTVAVVSGAGSLPTGTYRVRIAAVGSTGGPTNAGAASLNATVASAGQEIRVTLPALPDGASSWNVYLTDTGTAVGTERLYATGQTAGNFFCASASWMDGTVPYASADGLPYGAAIGYSDAISSHTGGFDVAAGVTVVSEGDVLLLGDFQLNAGSVLEFDTSNAPAGSHYILGFGSPRNLGTPKLVTRGASGNRAIVRSATGTTQSSLDSVGNTSTNGSVRLDCEWGLFSKLGGSGYEAIDGHCNQAFTQTLTDCVFDADCWTVVLRQMPATAGWNFTRVAFRQTNGVTVGGRTVSIEFRPAANASTGTRICTNVAFEVLPPAVCKGAALWDRCYFGNTWSNVSVGALTNNSEFRDCFFRKLQADAPNGINAPSTTFDTSDSYLYHDWITGGGTDLNPWGVEFAPASASVSSTWSGGVFEYNGVSGGGDAIFPPNTSGTTRIEGNLVVPAADGTQTSGNICTLNGITNPDAHIELIHNTAVGENGCCVVSEGGLSPSGVIAKLQSNLVYSVAGTSIGTSRFVLTKSTGTGDTDTEDVADPAFVSNNAAWNLNDITGNWTGAYRWYNTRFSVAPAGGDVELGTDPGADIATNGPQFVDPTRRFHTWAENVLSATGTTEEKIEAGLAALRAIADTTSADHVPGLLMTDPLDWVRAGFSPQNALLENAGHDGVTIGAIEGTFEAENTGSVAATLAAASLSASGTLLITASLTATLSDATLAAEGGSGTAGSLEATLEAATLAAAGTTSISGSLSATLNAASVAASGTTAIDGSLSATLDDATVAATGIGGEASGSLAVTLDDATVSAAGATTLTATLTVTLGDVLIFAAGTEHLTLPGAGTTWRARSKPTTCKALAKQMAWKG